MAVADTINSIKTHIEDAYGSIEEKGGTLPTNKNLQNLSTAIDSIEGGGGDISEYFKDNTSISTTSTKFLPNFIIKKIPAGNYKTSNMQYAFYYFTELEEIPYIDTSDCSSFYNAFSHCSSLKKIPKLDFSKVTNVNSMCSSVTTIIDLGGFENYGKAFVTSAPENNPQYSLQLYNQKNLTEQSLINVLNNLYDIANMGVKTQTCSLGSTNLPKLTSVEGQQALTDAQVKGWLIK